jgi:hypothetical protein
MELFLNLIDNPMDAHENDIDIVHEFVYLIQKELHVIEEFSYINNLYFLQEMDGMIDMLNH